MSHLHQYEQDTRAGREHDAVCSICGFTMGKRFVLSRTALILDRQLSADLLHEKTERYTAALRKSEQLRGNP